MMYVLLGESGACEVPRDVWAGVVVLARRYGWEPRGTIREPRWKGCYLTPLGQLVAARDASAMALAIEDALDDLPDDLPESGPGRHPADAASTPGATNLLERLGGARKALVCGLVEFLRGGAFMIYGSCGRHSDAA